MTRFFEVWKNMFHRLFASWGQRAVWAWMLLFLSACTVNPVTLKREFNIISDEREVRLGRNACDSVLQEFGAYQDPALQKYVDGVGQRLVKVSERNYLTFSFQVVDSPILNAFALPGGYIFISRGLLAELNNEAQLASVLGHEIGHVCARHSATQLTEALGMQIVTLAALAASSSAPEVAPVTAALFQSIMLGYSRDRENQADAMGLHYMYRAGYQPMEMTRFLTALSRKAQSPVGYSVYNSTHPDIFDRIRATRDEGKMMVAEGIINDKLNQSDRTGEASVTKEEINRAGGKVLEGEYKSHLDGLPYGPPETPRRIRIYTVQEGDTLATIADQFLGDSNLAAEIVDLNSLDVEAPLRPGQKLKIIV